MNKTIAWTALAAGALLLAGCSGGGSTPAPSASGATFTGSDAAFCDGVAELYQGMQDTQSAKSSGNTQQAGQALQELLSGARQMAANVPADAPASMKSDFQKYVSDLAQAVANPSAGAQIQQQVEDTIGPELTQYMAEKCPSAINP